MRQCHRDVEAYSVGNPFGKISIDDLDVCSSVFLAFYRQVEVYRTRNADIAHCRVYKVVLSVRLTNGALDALRNLREGVVDKFFQFHSLNFCNHEYSHPAPQLALS